jgi:hypothetical protein
MKQLRPPRILLPVHVPLVEVRFPPLVLPARAPRFLPLRVLDEQRMIDVVATWVEKVRHRLEKEFSREWLETALLNGLREGRLQLTIYAVEAADKGDEICDAALRNFAAELQLPLLQGRDLAPAHLQVITYLQRVARRAPHQRRGHRWHDNWMGNIQICVLIDLACRVFDVRPTRHKRTAHRANRAPSGVSLVRDALARKGGRHLEEGSVQENIWNGLPGEIVRGVLGPCVSLL